MSRAHVHFPSAPPASLSTIAYSTTSAIAFLPQSRTFTLPQFDELTYGKLWRVEFSVALTFRSVSRVENLDAVARPGTISGVTLNCALTGPAASYAYDNTTLQVSFTNNLAAYDGVSDYGGSSGVSNARRTQTLTESAGDATALAPYRGTGTFNVSEVSTGVGFVTGPTLWLLQVTPEPGMTLTVTYHYEATSAPSGISGTVWDDFNGNGVLEPGEPGLADVVLNLLDSNGDPTGVSATTDADGFYLFTGLSPGDYYVVYVLPSGYTATYDVDGVDGSDSFFVTVASGVVTTDQSVGMTQSI